MKLAKGFEGAISAIPTIQQEDNILKITRWDFEPGAVTGWHRHSWPYVVVMMTDALMRVHNGEIVSEFERKAGDSYSRNAGVEHDVMNGSSTRMSFIEIEIKRST